jgi:hypothetical protein
MVHSWSGTKGVKVLFLQQVLAQLMAKPWAKPVGEC